MGQLRSALPLLSFILVLTFGLVGQKTEAVAASETQQLVTQAKWTFERLSQHAQMGSLRRTLPEAKAVIIFPSVLKAAFLFGAEGGTGVMMVRLQNGGWSYPAFFTIGAASFGLQAGGEKKEIVALVMTDKAVNALIAAEVKLGGDVSVALGPVGAGIEGSTTTAVGADIVAYSLSKGAFAGLAFEGAVVHERESLNGAYYQPGATARDIVIYSKWMNGGAEELRQAVAQY
ncbi:MAG: lipid-binding SYLF domain-containing protein [Alphaproteobacteria bacterium]|nr:lipid-binding SYLF domain-containing protein [Alphaproteobacteria bacterium]